MLNTDIYKSDRVFSFSSFNISRSQFLLRSFSNPAQGNCYNIDIIFQGVVYIESPTEFNGLTINRINYSPNIITHASLRDLFKYETNKLFEITSEGRKSHIIASFFHVYENSFEKNEFRIKPVIRGQEKLIINSFKF